MTYARAIIAASGTSVVAVGADGATPAPVPDNCHTILVTNGDTSKIGYIGTGTPGGALTPGINAQRVPPGVTVPLPLGTAALRGFLDSASLAASSPIYDASAALTLEITYLNQLGGV